MYVWYVPWGDDCDGDLDFSSLTPRVLQKEFSSVPFLETFGFFFLRFFIRVADTTLKSYAKASSLCLFLFSLSFRLSSRFVL